MKFLKLTTMAVISGAILGLVFFLAIDITTSFNAWNWDLWILDPAEWDRVRGFISTGFWLGFVASVLTFIAAECNEEEPNHA